MKINPEKKIQILDALETIREFIESLDQRKSCHTCLHYYKPPICGKYDCEPPTQVKQEGCPDWEIFDTIPF